MKLPILALDVVETFTYWSTDPTNSQTAYLLRIIEPRGHRLLGWSQLTGNEQSDIQIA